MSAWDAVITTSKADHYSTDEDEESSVPLQHKIRVIKAGSQRSAANQHLHQTSSSLADREGRRTDVSYTHYTDLREEKRNSSDVSVLGFNQCYQFTQTLRSSSVLHHRRNPF